jgi:two-component system OmpR family sensor kinase/two-component system phosphate regulon sensor histidine kinase PhoR
MVIVSKPNNDRHFLSFSRKLFLSVISLFLVFAACFIAYQYQREKEYKVELLDMQLQDYNDRLHQELRYLPDSLWTSMLDSYISKHVNKELRVTVVDLHGNVLFDSSQNDSHELDNHIKRPEVQKALKDGKGYDLRRISETTGKTYFYSATAYEGCIIRSALPYNVNLMNNLAADPHYIWFTVIVSLLLISVFYKFTSKLGSAINHLREFAKRADKNEPIDMDIQAAFPHNELGEISQHIIQIYKRLRETKQLSLNETERRQEKERQEARLKSRDKGSKDKLAALQDDGLQYGERSLAADLAAEKARKDSKDVLLTEAARIVADEAELFATRTQLALRERVEISGGKGSSLR